MLLPVADQGSARVFSIWGDIEDKERYHHEEGPRDADVGSPQAVLARGSSPQAALRQPRMGAHVLLVFRARLLLHERYILPEGHRLSIQAFDRNRLDELP